MRRVLSYLVCLAVLGTAQPVMAESGPLAPGKAAGVVAAQNNVSVDKLAVAGAVGLVLVGVYLVVGTHYNNYPHKNNQSDSTASGTH